MAGVQGRAPGAAAVRERCGGEEAKAADSPSGSGVLAPTAVSARGAARRTRDRRVRGGTVPPDALGRWGYDGRLKKESGSPRPPRPLKATAVGTAGACAGAKTVISEPLNEAESPASPITVGLLREGGRGGVGGPCPRFSAPSPAVYGAAGRREATPAARRFRLRPQAVPPAAVRRP